MMSKYVTAGLVAVLAVMVLVLTIGAGEVASTPPPGGCVIDPATDPQVGTRSSTATTGPPGSGVPPAAPTPTGPIPSVGPGTTSATQRDATLDVDQMAAARTIARVGVERGIAPRGVAIALGTAMQESSMNPAAVNGRSIGLFQQQGELYRFADRRNPAAASAAFYGQLVVRVPHYANPASGTFADIAQEVQRSGAGAIKYAEWEAWATALADFLLNGTTPNNNQPDDQPGGQPGDQPGDQSTAPVPDPVGEQVVCEPGGSSGPMTVLRDGVTVTLPARAGIAGTITFPNAAAATAAAAAMTYLGTLYTWGGGGPNGPSVGIPPADAITEGFDCSGLTEYAWAQAGVAIGGDSRTQRAIAGPVHPYTEALPGDLLFYGTGPISAIHHVAIYLGIPTPPGGNPLPGTPAYMIEAPRSGDVVKVTPVRTGGDFRNEVVRPQA